MASRGPERAPRRPQDGPRGLQDGPRGPQDGSKRVPRRRTGTDISSPRLREGQHAPRSPERSPRGLKTRGSEEALGKPEEAPERRRRGCRAAPKRPAGSSQEASHCSPEVVETSPKGSQEASLRCLIHVIVVFVANAVAVAVAVVVAAAAVVVVCCVGECGLQCWRWLCRL